jgi:hypothetical protein
MAQLVKVTGIINASQSPDGKPKQPGDWIEIKNKQTLAKWVADGKVEVPHFLQAQAASAIFSDDCAALVLCKPDAKVPMGAFKDYASAIKIVKSKELHLPAKHNLIWTPRFPLTKQQLIIGFSLISADREGYDAWDMAAMMLPDTMLAGSVGTKEDRAKTKALIGDLRLPAYNTGAFWVKRSEQTEAIIAAMQSELDEGAGQEHAFLRAVYDTPIKLCTLPATWLKP